MNTTNNDVNEDAEKCNKIDVPDVSYVMYMYSIFMEQLQNIYTGSKKDRDTWVFRFWTSNLNHS